MTDPSSLAALLLTARSFSDNTPALVEPGRTWTYREADTTATSIGAELSAAGVGRGDVVAVLGGRHARSVLGALAGWRVGAVFLMVDPQLPAARIATLLADSNPGAILTDGTCTVPTPGDVPVIDLPAGPADHTDEGPVTPCDTADTDPAYLVYTSGTTGTPKGVLVSYGGVRRVLVEQRRILDVGPGARVYQAAPVSFDAFVFEILMAFGGGTLVLPGHRSLLPGRDMVERLRSQRVTHLVTTPTALAAMDSADLPSLRVVCSVGEACTGGVRDAWAPGRRLLNLYGPAEATIWATFSELSAGSDPTRIGRPIVGVDALVLDEARRPVQPGTPGELYLAGPTVAVGYLGRPDLTAERFVTGPDGVRAYRTGDLVVVEPDGELRFCGRVDRQLKVRGVRVEPAEIERAITAYPGIRLALVTATATAGASDRSTLTAVYAPPQQEPARVAAYLRERLPRWMVPQRLVGVDQMPMAPTGKIDERAVLRMLDEDGDDAVASAAAPPQSPVQLALLEMARDLLNAPALSLDDNFFDGGGDSLVALDLIVRAGDALDRELDLEALFAAATLGEWAAAVEEQVAQPGGARRPPRRGAPAGYDRVSVGQAELLAAEQLLAGSAAYVSSWCELVEGPFNPDALAVALTEAVRAHEILRTRYRVAGGRLACVVDVEADVRWDATEAATRDEAIALAARAAGAPIRLEREQPVRLHTVRVGADKHLVTVLVHHAVCDETSIGLLLDEVWARYEGTAAAVASSVRYLDFTAWQQDFLASAAADELRDWWGRQLEGSSPVTLGTPGGGARHGRRHGFTVDERLTAQADTVRQELGLSPFALLSAAFAVALEPYTTGEQCVVGTPCVARGLPDFERALGFFVNTLPLRLRVPEHRPARDWLTAWQNECAASFARRDLPLAEISARWRRHGGAQPLAVLFSLGYAAHLRQPSGLVRQHVRLDPGPVKFELVFTLTRTAHKWTGEVVYDSAVATEAEAAELVGRFTEALATLCRDSGCDVAELRPQPAVVGFDLDFDLGPPR